jgi:hypothetical protein
VGGHLKTTFDWCKSNHWTLFTQLNKDGDCRSLHGRVLDARDSFVSASSAVSILRLGWPDHGPAPVVGDSADTFPDADSKLRPPGSISIRYDYTVTRVFPTGRTQNGIDAAGGQQERFAFPEEARRGVAAPRMRTKIGGQRGGARVVSGAPCVEREVPAAALCGLAWHAKNDGGAGRTPVGLVILGQTRGGA